VWTSHNLIVELNDQTFWYWNAPKDAHGTTQNMLALTNPKKYQRFITHSKYKDQAQWTRVFVMPHAVVEAALREDRREKERMSLSARLFSD
jgi:hypothetical protein